MKEKIYFREQLSGMAVIADKVIKEENVEWIRMYLVMTKEERLFGDRKPCYKRNYEEGNKKSNRQNC